MVGGQEREPTRARVETEHTGGLSERVGGRRDCEVETRSDDSLEKIKGLWRSRGDQLREWGLSSTVGTKVDEIASATHFEPGIHWYRKYSMVDLESFMKTPTNDDNPAAMQAAWIQKKGDVINGMTSKQMQNGDWMDLGMKYDQAYNQFRNGEEFETDQLWQALEMVSQNPVVQDEILDEWIGMMGVVELTADERKRLLTDSGDLNQVLAEKEGELKGLRKRYLALKGQAEAYYERGEGKFVSGVQLRESDRDYRRALSAGNAVRGRYFLETYGKMSLKHEVDIRAEQLNQFLMVKEVGETLVARRYDDEPSRGEAILEVIQRYNSEGQLMSRANNRSAVLKEDELQEWLVVYHQGTDPRQDDTFLRKVWDWMRKLGER